MEDFLFVPRHFAEMTGQKVLTQQWITGRDCHITCNVARMPFKDAI